MSFNRYSFLQQIRSGIGPGDPVVFASDVYPEFYFRQSRAALVEIQVFGDEKVLCEKPPQLSFSGDRNAIGRWLGENAFGATKPVDVVLDEKFSISIANCGEFQCIEGSDSMFGRTYTIRCVLRDVPSDTELMYLVVGEITSFADKNVFRSKEATYFDPLEIQTASVSLFATIKQIWFCDSRTGTIFRKILITNPSTWREDLAVLSLAGDGQAASFLAKKTHRLPEKLKWTRVAAANGDEASKQELSSSFTQIGRMHLEEVASSGDPEAAWKAFESNQYTTRYAELAKWLFTARSIPAAASKIADLSKPYSVSLHSELVSAFRAEEEKFNREIETGNRQRAQQEINDADVRSAKRTIEWLSERALRGSDSAQFELARRYLDGRGVEKDERKAVGLLRSAAAQGHRDAEVTLERMGQ